MHNPHLSTRWTRGWGWRLLVVGTAFALRNAAVAASADDASLPDFSQMSAATLSEALDDIEAVLIRRLGKRDSLESHEMRTIIGCLARLQSQRAVPILLSMIDFSTSGKNPAWDASWSPGTTWPAYGALLAISKVSIDECLTQIRQSEGGSGRRVLLLELALALHGDAFKSRVKTLCDSQDEGTADFWKRVYEGISHGQQ